ncbi:MAG TPA: M15 family metallopeptidase [Clostridiales bacterium]|nr:M15 family metallopeptidase [Clostridiales bacterium]
MAKYMSRKKKRERMRKIQITIAIVLASILILSVIYFLIIRKAPSDDVNSSNLLVEPVNVGKSETSTTELIETETETETEVETTIPVVESTVTSATQPVTEAPVETINENPVEPTYINGVLIVNKSYKLPQDYNPGSLDETVVNSFYQMQEEVKAEGLSIWVASGFRSYEDQDRIYNRYVAREGQAAADTFSARAGFSEHQTGLAFDLNSIDDSFADTAEGAWVADNAHRYGFIIRYPKGKESITGYKYEPWHLRYVGIEFATELYNSGLTLEEYFNIMSVYKSN